MQSAAVFVHDFWLLAKPRVVSLIAFTAAVGAALAMTRVAVSLPAVALSLLGITLVASSAAAFNCLVERALDSVMTRTCRRPLPAGRVGAMSAAVFSAFLGIAGMWLTTQFGGALTAWLTGLTFFGYAIVYTLFLKHATPQNIVIGGAAGAMPPLLGWVAVAGEVSFEPLLLFLIIFVWTPPHFWALALYRREDYARAKLPMLPVTHGIYFTAVQIFLYSIMLLAASLLPVLTGMAGGIYGTVALLLGGRFIWLARGILKTLDAERGRRLFSFSIHYLALLFAALFVDAVVG